MTQPTQQIINEMRDAAGDFEQWGRDVIEGFADRLEALQADAREKGEAVRGGSVRPTANSLWFPVDVLGGPMREYSPGKWESATWPSDALAATQPAQASEAAGDADRLDWIASQCRTPTVYMSGMYEFSANHKMRRLIGQTFRQAIDRAMANENEPTYQAATSSQETASE